MSTKKKVSEATASLRVAIRVRPMNSAERSEKCTTIVKTDKTGSVVNLKGKQFGPFFRVYDPDTTQADIYQDLVSSQIKKVIAGFNCTVFAYGQTGTGKTFTMEGGRRDVKSSHDDPSTGIVPRAVEDIFEQLENSGCEEYSLRVSYVELYNEELLDLLSSSDSDDRERLRIFDDPNKKGVIVSGVEEVPVRNRADVFKLLEIGAEKRKTAATMMNMHSSRSHSLFMVNVVIRENTNTGEELVKQGKLNLVDLAGSENIGRSGALGSRAKEAGSINQSLLTLGRVIRSLTTNSQHIPYRESKLTRLLQDSLGGSTITSLIATLSPSSSNFEESQSTLEYAMRAANIKNKPVCNTKVSKKTILKEYSEEIEKLRRDLRAAREKNGVIISEESHEEFQRNTEKVHELEQQLDSVVDRLRRFTEDLMHMDEQYKQLYERKGMLEDRLRVRQREMAEAEKELAETKDELIKYMDALDKMHTTSARTFDQLLKTRDAAEEMQTDLSAFWRKVDEMKNVEETNAENVSEFVQNMNSFVAKIAGQSEAMTSRMMLAADEVVSSQHQPCLDANSISEHVSSTTKMIESTSRAFAAKVTQLEADASRTLSDTSGQVSARWAKSLGLYSEYHRKYAATAKTVQMQVLERLGEIRRMIAEFVDDTRPVITNLRGTICETADKTTKSSEATAEKVKITCSAMAENLRAIMAQMEELSVHVDTEHRRQVVVVQEAQETALSGLNTLENVVQSIEDNIDEQCDVKQEVEEGERALESIADDIEKAIETDRNAAVEDEAVLKDVVQRNSDAIKTIEAASVEATVPLCRLLMEDAEKMRTVGEAVTMAAERTASDMKSVMHDNQNIVKKSVDDASEATSCLQFQHTDPSRNVPERVIPDFPLSDELISPPHPDALLGTSDVDDDENSDVVLMAKKRRVTTFIRRDSLLDTTNVFASPSAIQKRREQAIEEEDEF